MKIWNLASLPWLLPAPDDFNDSLRSVEKMLTSEEKGNFIQRLVSHNLNISQLMKLGSYIKKAIEGKTNLSPLKVFRLAILSNSTTDLWGLALISAAARYGIALDLFVSPYDQIMQEVLDPSSSLNKGKYDAVFLCLDHRALPFQNAGFGDLKREQESIQEAIDYIKVIRNAIRENCKAPVIFQTIPKTTTSVFGSFDSLAAGTPTRMIEEFNKALRVFTVENNDYILDTSTLAERIGTETWHNPKHWNMYKLPFDQNLVPLYVDYLARLIGCIKGNSRKCLVIDLDNTLWGGIIGDDGLEGILLGQGDPVGESFLEIQQTVCTYRDRGIILAVCSKNEDEAARLPFRKHPEMILKEEDISAFIANWNDKASNIIQIAKMLNIGLDSIVFFDDNPAERAQVSAALPMVAVPELPSDPAYYTRALMSAGYFETISYSQEDKTRTDQYQSNIKRQELLSQMKDVDSYLKSLEMKIMLAPFDSVGLSRIAQLINKSNQYNLTTHRYSESEILDLMKDSSVFTLQVRLEDRFGDNGMISVIICRLIDDVTWEIDTWLMSCRVIGRCVEQAVLNELVRVAEQAGIKTILGVFKPSGKNNLVINHYKKLGFSQKGNRENDSLWVLDVKSYKAYETPMEKILQPTLEDAA